jgi:hypothetical protein
MTWGLGTGGWEGVEKAGTMRPCPLLPKPQPQVPT